MDLIEIHATPPLTFLIHVDLHQRKGRCNKIKQWIKMVASHTLSSPEPLLKGDWPKKKKNCFSFLCCVIKKKVRKDWIHPKLMPILDKPSSTSTHSPSLSDEKPQEQTTTWAWLGTVVCMVLNSSCAIMWMTASSTPTVMADWMAISLTQLNWLSNGSAILNALVSFITPLAYDKLGIRSSVSIPPPSLSWFIPPNPLFSLAHFMWSVERLGLLGSNLGHPCADWKKICVVYDRTDDCQSRRTFGLQVKK